MAPVHQVGQGRGAAISVHDRLTRRHSAFDRLTGAIGRDRESDLPSQRVLNDGSANRSARPLRDLMLGPVEMPLEPRHVEPTEIRPVRGQGRVMDKVGPVVPSISVAVEETAVAPTTHRLASEALGVGQWQTEIWARDVALDAASQ